MSLVKTWYEPQAAADKFGIPLSRVKAWVDDGLVRFENEEGKLVRVNIDDVSLEVETMVRFN
ncbi:MerR family transcriptional regulator [Geothermobacter hydrogeniphilus]|uniref:MerR family transcriptional regulator n=1 Tax=Geothermobacter hydrogeniphilus TaxID=1969733 RepID=A0A2K2H815_9BACT|nr:MerR family transcriptional regulator [Geothermobacter hydrogeniphilus]PNU19370.1 MerR family transcriptional regulator [Geothermobacter hydrogeniphilus]